MRRLDPTKNILRRMPALFAIAILSLGVLGGSGTKSVRANFYVNPAADDQKAVLYCLEVAFSSIAQRAEPGVVSITAIQHTGTGASLGGDERSDVLHAMHPVTGVSGKKADTIFPSQSRDTTVKASGSGSIVRHVGNAFYILTNYHVVERTYQVSVRLGDETDLKGTVVGIDPATDLAVVKVSSPELSDKNVLAMGNSDGVKVGDWALAVGNPYGFEQTLTVGVVSALHRVLDEEDAEYPDLIQTDAAINKGNSGGPLLDVEGHIIGVNAAIASPTGGSIGLGFAIPSNVARGVLDDLITKGRVIRGWIGVGAQEMTPVLKEFYGTDAGVMIASLDDGSPAAKSGVRSEDILIGYGNSRVADIRQLQRLISESAPSSVVTVTVIRAGQTLSLPVTVGVSPATPTGRPSPPPQSRDAGIQVRTLTDALAREIGLGGTSGVVVVGVQVGGSADDAGLEEGDIVVRFNGREVSDDSDFAEKLRKVPSGGIVVLKVIRKGSPRIVGFRAE